MKIVSWNVNGIRAIMRKGFLEWLVESQPEILCIQETKAHKEQLSEEILKPLGYQTYWHSAQKKGYSSVATFSKTEPKSVQYGLGIERFDYEGRVLVTEHDDFFLFNIYFPNGKRNDERLQYKMDFYHECLTIWNHLVKQGKKLIICGDYNTAHKDIDLARPKPNRKISGFLPIETEWMDQLVADGFIDTFREFNTEPHQYTWWDYQSKARDRNVGWRIDYHFISQNLKDRLQNAEIWQQVMGSDHCPVVIDIQTSDS